MAVSVRVDKHQAVWTITLDRASARNAIDRATATSLAACFREFEDDADARAAVLTGAGGVFCAGADLKALAEGLGNRVEPDGDAPLGPTRMMLTKPVIAAVEGHAVAGGLELALWCDLRVADETAIFGVFCRRWGVPLIDGGTVRLPRLIGQSRALDMILTGRAVDVEEALAMGLVNRRAQRGKTLEVALSLAKALAAFPQECLRADRASVYAQDGLSFDDAIKAEFARAAATIEEAVGGAKRFAAGAGRHGVFEPSK